MKAVLIILVLLVSQSIMASVNCDIYHVMPEVDGRYDLTEKVLKKFEAKGYKITEIEKPSDIREQGKVSFMTVFSDIHYTFGARTSITLVDLEIQGRTIISRNETEIKVVKKPFFGSAENALLKAVENSIPSCVR